MVAMSFFGGFQMLLRIGLSMAIHCHTVAMSKAQ